MTSRGKGESVKQTSEWTTAVSAVLPDNKVLIRGYSHEAIIEAMPHSDAVFLTLRGELPNPAESRMFNALLNSLLDHGFVAASVVAARYIASGNPQFIPAVAGGLLSAGRNTINPEDALRFIRDCHERQVNLGVSVEEAASLIAEDIIATRSRIPGIGHPTHRGYDFRAKALRQIAVECGFFDEPAVLYECIHAEFVRKKQLEHIPINVDGMMACVANAMGFSEMEVAAIAALAVLPGLMAHVIEEIREGPPLRHIAPAVSTYTGAPERVLQPTATDRPQEVEI
jgi:citrate synthase